jgi:oligopeptide/dipeptide ABC transporter ATP-binding protein
MYLGVIVEMGETQELFDNPLHPYTKALMAAVPVPEPEAVKEEYKIKGEPPDPVDMPQGCRFMPRCPYAFDRCHNEPQLERDRMDHSVRCWLYIN